MSGSIIVVFFVLAVPKWKGLEWFALLGFGFAFALAFIIFLVSKVNVMGACHARKEFC
jgi:hypothetical protein